MRIGIIGEALMDLMPQTDGTLKPLVGGSPFNVARALGRNGIPCSYLSPISNDHFGNLLTQALRIENVDVNSNFRSPKPTSLAVVSLSKSGQPNYSLYREGIADRDYSAHSLLEQFTDDLTIIHTGSLAIVPADIERIRQILLSAREHGILVSVDINMRPGVVPDMQKYEQAVCDLLPLCDLVKASDEDLELLGLVGSAEQLGAQLLKKMTSGTAVVTLGAAGSIAYSSSQPDSPINQCGFNVNHVQDSVGAGDCFMAGMLAALLNSGYLSTEKFSNTPPEVLADALRRASATAAINVMRRGCQPPTYQEVEDYLRSNE